jgi:hypothetical protein
MMRSPVQDVIQDMGANAQLFDRVFSARESFFSASNIKHEKDLALVFWSAFGLNHLFLRYVSMYLIYIVKHKEAKKLHG